MLKGGGTQNFCVPYSDFIIYVFHPTHDGLVHLSSPRGPFFERPARPEHFSIPASRCHDIFSLQTQNSPSSLCHSISLWPAALVEVIFRLLECGQP